MNLVYPGIILNLNYLKVRITTNAVSTATREILINVWAVIDHCLDVCVATNGGYIKID